MKSRSNSDEQSVKLFNWEMNPFNFRILPELFVGYSEEREKLIELVRSNEKFSLLLGPTGSGKTTLLRHILSKFSDSYETLYLPKPPKNPQDLVDILNRFTSRGILGRVFSRKKNINLYNLSESVNKKMKKMKIIMLVDESHESSVDTLEWLRTITDQVDNLGIVLAGLPILDNVLRENLETFMFRVNTKIELTNLTRSETRELIKKRIEWAGGDDVKPFTSEAIDFIYEKTNGFPREVIRTCNELIRNAIRKNISTVDLNFLKETETGPSQMRRMPMGSIEDLPQKQREILTLIGKKGEMSPSEIVEKLNIDEYKDKPNAIRSINNILKRLLKEGMLLRKEKGRSYKYMLSEKIKTFMVNA